MRLMLAAGLIVSMSGADIERALAIARSRDAERQQFHHRYVVDLTDPSVTQIEVITEFRKLVTIAEDHVLRGDLMFTRGLRAAQEAIAPFHGHLTVRAQVRFSPLNTYIQPPPYTIGLGSGASMTPVDTQLLPQYSVPFKARGGKTVSSLIGVSLETTIDPARIGQGVQTIGVMLAGKDVAHASFDFGRLD